MKRIIDQHPNGTTSTPDEESLRMSIDAVYEEAGGLPLTADEKRYVEACWAELDEIRAADK